MFIDLFFQLEREYILQTPSDSDAETPQAAAKPDARRIGKDIDEDMPSRYQLIHLNDEWYKSASGKRSSKNQPKRKHRKTHGKIGFLELSSVISKRWHNLQELDAETKSYVAKVAARLLEEYKSDMAAFKAQNLASMSNPALFPVMPTSSFVPNMTYLAQQQQQQPSGMFQYPMANYASPPTLPTPPSVARKPSPNPPRVDSPTADFDQLLQQMPVSFKVDVRIEAGVKDKEPVDPLSAFTFHPVSNNDYMKRKTTKQLERSSKRRRRSSSKRPSRTLMKIELEKAKLKRKIRALQHQILIQRQRNSPSPKGVDDRYRAPCPITPASGESASKMHPVNSEDLMNALQGSDLFAWEEVSTS